MQTYMSSREFNHSTSKAKQAAFDGPVIVTDRGKPSHVLLSIKDYKELKREEPKSVAELLGHAESADIELELPPRTIEPMRPIDF